MQVWDAACLIKIFEALAKISPDISSIYQQSSKDKELIDDLKMKLEIETYFQGSKSQQNSSVIITKIKEKKTKKQNRQERESE